VDIHTSYDITDHIQIYGLVNNLFDSRYGLFGTLFDPEEATEAGEPSGYVITNPQGIVPAPPFAAYGGDALAPVIVHAILHSAQIGNFSLLIWIIIPGVLLPHMPDNYDDFAPYVAG
jgi:hypothetical protein